MRPMIKQRTYLLELLYDNYFLFVFLFLLVKQNKKLEILTMQHIAWHKSYMIMTEGRTNWDSVWHDSFKEDEERGLVEIGKRHSRDSCYQQKTKVERKGTRCMQRMAGIYLSKAKNIIKWKQSLRRII